MVAGKARKASAIKLSVEERDFLLRLVRRRKVARGDAQRAEIILRAANGLNNCEIADAVGVTRQTVRTCTRDAFLLQATLHALQGTTEVCHRHWDCSIPRDFL